MTNQIERRAATRLGFHYFPDTLHYREIDLQTWLPEIKALGGSWLTLIAPLDRAIPETFLRGLISQKVEPVLHFHLPLDRSADLDSLGLLLDAYAEWDVRLVTLYDRPNLRSKWPASAWAQSDLVERFLDIYLPAASLAVQAGLIPVFPPLEPGGDYWDTAFLRAALQGIVRRGQTELAEKLVLGAYAWTGERCLGWGAGGPERWPQSRPYYTPPGQEDHLGFYVFDWYMAIAEAVLGRPCPVIMLAGGATPPIIQEQDNAASSLEAHAQTNLAIARLLEGIYTPGSETLPPVSSNVLACNFWLLAADSRSKDARAAWFQPDGKALPVVKAVTRLWAVKDGQSFESAIRSNLAMHASLRPIANYILVPREPAAASRTLQCLWHTIAGEFPTIGFSTDEAALAAHVSIAGDEQIFPEEVLQSLRSAGCSVERLEVDGISIAPIE